MPSYLQQLPIKRTTRIILKALRSNAFKIILGSGLSAKRCKYSKNLKAAPRVTFKFLLDFKSAPIAVSRSL
jgi:hypothetical protein